MRNRLHTGFNQVQEVNYMAEIWLNQSGIIICVPYSLLISIADNAGGRKEDDGPV